MQLDLRRDFEDIYTHLSEQVRGFVPSGGNVLGDPGLVKAVEVGYECSQAGWLVIVFDTRPDAAPDGEWTSLIEGNELERLHWVEASNTLMEGELAILQLDGKETVLPAGTEFADILNEVVKSVLLKAREDGVFATLPKAPGCELLVEHFDGASGWPEYEARGQDNLVEPLSGLPDLEK